MRNRLHAWLIVGFILFFTVTQATAQEEQWLQYHSQREAQPIIGNTEAAAPTMTTDRPQDVELPAFKSQQQFFTQWSTPMVPSGKLWVALDRSKEQGRWDRLFLDSNGNGHLNDETAVTAYRIE